MPELCIKPQKLQPDALVEFKFSLRRRRKLVKEMMPSTLSVRFYVLLSALVCVLDAWPLYSSTGEISEISGDDVQDVHVPLSDRQRWHLMARQLHRDVKSLRDEQFDRDFRDTGNMTSFENVRIKTPGLKASDGCLSRNFSTEMCLGRIYSVLMWYKENMNYIERENLTQSLMNNVKHGTKRLLEAISSQVQLRDTRVEDFSGSSLQARSAWTRKTLAHAILFNFTDVMIDASRAIHYMSKRKTGDGHQRKDKKKTSDWVSDKN